MSPQADFAITPSAEDQEPLRALKESIDGQFKKAETFRPGPAQTRQAEDPSSKGSPAEDQDLDVEIVATHEEHLALGAAMLGLANLDRAIRHLPHVTSATDMHPASAAAFLKAARVIAMAQHPSARLHAVAVASEALSTILEGLITDTTAAIVNDPERMKDASQGMVRRIVDTYQQALYDSLATVRVEQQQ